MTDKQTYVDDKLGDLCDVNGKFAFVVHGWNGGYGSWFDPITKKLLQYRGGCIILMDYKFYSDIKTLPLLQTYFPLIANFSKVVNPDGHSLGSRLIIDAATNFGKQKIKEIDGEIIRKV